MKQSLAMILALTAACQPHSPALTVVPSAAAKSRNEGLFRAAESEKSEAIRDWATLVGIDSGSDDGEGLARVGDVVAARLRDLGAAVEVANGAPSPGKLVRGTLEGMGTARILLMIHLDTVFTKGEAARRPFKIEGNRARGPGVADAKGGVIIVLHALKLLRDRGFKGYRTLSIIFNADEEVGSPGSSESIKALAAEQDDVLSFEPPDAERVIIGTNGIAHVELTVKGRASHAGGAPEKGRNAAVELSAQIMRLLNLGDAAKGTTVNWTRIRSGDRINVIPDTATAIADMRMSDMGELARVQKDADDVIRKHVVPDTEVRDSVEERRPAFR
ncbi:MAG TPA: glutamate carboxypeptidase, partial [Polyangiaceae bacterium]